MNRVRKNHTVGVAGGVLSLFGLCVAILSVGKNTGERTGAARMPPAPPKPQPSPSLAATPCEPGEALEPQPGPVAVSEAHQPSDLNAAARSSREMIADLAAQGQPAVAIAKLLGISVGEVQLTLRLQARTGPESADAAEERKIFRSPSNPVAESSIGQ